MAEQLTLNQLVVRSNRTGVTYAPSPPDGGVFVFLREGREIFVGFHFRTFQAIPTLPAALMVAIVLFLAGCGWGWQVQQDRTVVWAMLQHSLFHVLISLFEWT
jgi:hypothetical protein